MRTEAFLFFYKDQGEEDKEKIDFWSGFNYEQITALTFYDSNGEEYVQSHTDKELWLRDQ